MTKLMETKTSQVPWIHLTWGIFLCLIFICLFLCVDVMAHARVYDDLRLTSGRHLLNCSLHYCSESLPQNLRLALWAQLAVPWASEPAIFCLQMYNPRRKLYRGFGDPNWGLPVYAASLWPAEPPYSLLFTFSSAQRAAGSWWHFCTYLIFVVLLSFQALDFFFIEN